MSTFTDVIGGVTVADPYRWLEDDTDPAVVAWQSEQDARAAKELATSTHAARVRAAVEATYADMFAYAAPQRFGSTWFRLVTPPGRAAQVLEVSDSPTGAGRVLVDPADEGPDHVLSVWTPSPDGRQVVVGTGPGTASLHIRVLDVETGTVLLDGLPNVGTFFFAWADNGFYFQAMGMTTDADGNPMPETQIWWQPLDGSAPQRQDLALDHPTAWPIVSADGRWVAVMADQTAPRPRWVRPTGGEWRRFLPDAAAMYKGSFVGDEFWAISDDTSGWCRLVAIPVATASDKSTWRELVAATPGTKLSAATPCGSRVALASVREGVATLTVLGRDGVVVGDVPLPGGGAIGKTGVGHIMSILGDVVVPDGDGCVFVYSSLDHSPGVFRADLLSLSVSEVVAAQHILADRSVDVRTAEGPQGAVVYRVLRRSSTVLDGSAPVIVTGYGGFNVPWLPCYWALAAAWTELGGVWVHAHLRGGGEQDDEFWHAGRMHRKQGTFDDLYAVLRDLVSSGIADPARLGVWGSSNGGLLVGATVTQQPSLVRAAVAQVPILDLLQCRKDAGTIGICMADYGNPDDPADAPVMHAYSPYHQVREGVAYPAVLCDAGANDPTCPAWHSRKMVARLQEATGSGRRVLLRARHGSGHNQMTTGKAVERDIEELTFFADELGLPR